MDDFLVDKKQVRRAFSRAAHSYDAAAVLQREVCTRMLERLDYVKLSPQRILDAGCGTGWGSTQLSQRYPAAHLTALDIAMGMLDVARGDTRWWHKFIGGSRRSYVCADVESLPFEPSSLDLIWSNLTLQWCNDLPAAFKGLHKVLHTDGLLMFSTFGPDTLKELRSAFEAVDERRHVNRFADMHDIGDMLTAAGFTEPVMDMETLTLTYSDLRAVMQDLKSIGAHNVTLGRSRGMMGKMAWQRLTERYEQFRVQGKLPATFEVVYGHAWKPTPTQLADGRAIIKTDFRL